MTHPVLDTFDRMMARIHPLLGEGIPSIALFFSPGSAPSLMGMLPFELRFQPLDTIARGGHKNLAVRTQIPFLLDAATAFQASLRTVPGLEELFATSMLGFAQDDWEVRADHEGDTSLDDVSISWHPDAGTMDLTSLIFQFHQLPRPVGVFRGALEQALSQNASALDDKVPCALLEQWMHGERYRFYTYPTLLASLEDLVQSGAHSRVALRPRDVAFDADPGRHSTPTTAPPAEVDAVEQAYMRLLRVLQERPAAISYALFVADTEDTCCFHHNDDDAPSAVYPAARKRVDGGACAPPMPSDDAPWEARATALWHAFVASFPPGRHWDHTVPLLTVEASPDTPIGMDHHFDLHPLLTKVPFSVERIGAWLTPLSGARAFVQTSPQGPILRIDAENDAAAAALACAMCPPIGGHHGTVRVWDRWSDSPTPGHLQQQA